MTRTFRVLVCGGRDYGTTATTTGGKSRMAASDERRELVRALDLIRTICETSPGKLPLELCHGGARGADALAGEWAAEHGVPCRVFPADWDKHGKAAGCIRNQQMLDEFRPDSVLAFQGGRGTADMIARARRAKVNVDRVGCAE